MWLVIETFFGPEYAAIITDKDGNNMVFDTLLKALEARKECQAGIVIKIE